jgi:hypothetical protein
LILSSGEQVTIQPRSLRGRGACGVSDLGVRRYPLHSHAADASDELEGAIRGKPIRTTMSDKAGALLANRNRGGLK